MSSSGLGKTDIADGGTLGLIGGIAGEFYSRNAAHYGTTAPPSYDHEPHVAMNTFRALLANSSVTMLRGGHGLNVVSVSKSGAQIRSLAVADGRNFTAEVFIDCSYEGDLLAAAGGSYTVGREAADLYNESMAGRRPDDFSNNGYEFPLRLDPYDAAGQPLPLLEPEDEDPGTPGEGDARVQAYNFRLCATADPRAAMRAPFPAIEVRPPPPRPPPALKTARRGHGPVAAASQPPLVAPRGLRAVLKTPPGPAVEGAILACKSKRCEDCLLRYKVPPPPHPAARTPPRAKKMVLVK
jgi:hypothetical protein